MSYISTGLHKAHNLEKVHFRNKSANTYVRIEWINPLIMLVLTLVGIFFIYSAQAYSQGGYWQKQIFWIGLSFCFYVFVSGLDYKLWIQNSHWIYCLAILILFLTVTPLGVARFGAQRWLDLKFFQLQPTELAKIGTLIMSASILSRSEILGLLSLRTTFFKIALTTGLPMIIVLNQPDLGSSLIFPPMSLALLYVSGFPKRFFYLVGTIVFLFVLVVGTDLFLYKKFIEKETLRKTTDI